MFRVISTLLRRLPRGALISAWTAIYIAWSTVLFAEQIEPGAVTPFAHAGQTFQAGKYDEAAKEYQAIRQKFPGGTADILSSYTLALIATYQRNFAGAAQEIQSFRARFPNSDLNFDVTYLEGAIEYSQQHYERAYQVITAFDLAKHRPSDPAKIQAFYQLAAQSAANLGNHPVAVAIVAFQLRLGPDDPTKNSLFQRLDGYLGNINSREALGSLLNQITDPAVTARIKARLAALEGTPASANMDPNALALLKQAQALLQQARFDEAAVLFKQIRDQFRGSAADELASYGLAITHIYRKDYASAMPELQSFLTRFPNSERAFEVGYLWAAVEMEMKEYDKVYRIVAGFDFVKIPKQSPQRVQAFYELGAQAAVQLGNFPLAISVATFQRRFAANDALKGAVLQRIDEYLAHIDRMDVLDQLLRQTTDPGVVELIKARQKMLSPQLRNTASNENLTFTPKSSDLTLGLNYVFPLLCFQQAFSPSFAIGIQSLLINYPSGGGPSLSGVAGMVTVNYYPDERFSGLWLQGGAGLYALSANVNGQSGNLNSPALMATLGWRWYWPSGTNLGFGAGANYLLKNQPNGINFRYSSILPALVIDYGFGF